jgi:hypothetical protein
MTTKRGKAKEVSLGEHFGDVALKVNGVCVEIQSGAEARRLPRDRPPLVTITCD